MSARLSVAVLGAGTMGEGIAHAFAQHGHDVCLADIDQAALVRAAARLADWPLRTVTRVADAATGADLVLETVSENMTVKRHVWTSISAAAPDDAVLASNTSSLDIEGLAGLVENPQRVLGVHFFNPAHLVPCVEVVRLNATADAVTEQVLELLRGIGKRPAVVANAPGFVANRIQMAMAAEVFRCLEEGLASAQDIDEIVQYSLGFRLAEFGPLRIADLAGLDIYEAIYGTLNAAYPGRFPVPQTVQDNVAEGRLGTKSGAGIYDYADGDVEALIRRRDDAFLSRANDASCTETATREGAIHA